MFILGKELIIQEENKDDATGGGGAASPEAPNAEPNNITDDPVDDFEEKFTSRLMEVAREKGLEVQSIDDLFVKPEPIEVVKNPYEKIDPSVKSFLDFHAETQRPYEDYLALQQDISTIPDIELARERVRQDTGQNLTDEEIDRYLEKKLNVDLSDITELDVADKIELAAFAKATREAKIEQQKKYKQPIEPKKPEAEKNAAQEADMVTLENGEKMPKATYDKLVEARQSYVKGITESVDSIAKTVFSVEIDENGVKKQIAFDYDYSATDKQNMLSNADDLEQTISKLFKSEAGMNHAELVESMFWIDKKNRESAISALLQKARAEGAAEVLKNKHNTNFGNISGIPGVKKNPVVPGASSGFGVKIPFNSKN